MFQAIFGEKVCGLLNDFNWKTLLVSSSGFTARDIDYLRRELLFIPGAKFLNAKRLKETVVAGKSMWEACRLSSWGEGHIKNATDYPPDARVFPPLTAADILKAAIKCRKTTDLGDPTGRAKFIEEVANTHAQKLDMADYDISSEDQSDESLH